MILINITPSPQLLDEFCPYCIIVDPSSAWMKLFSQSMCVYLFTVGDSAARHPCSSLSRLDFRWRRQPRVDEHADRAGAAVPRRRGLRGHHRRGQRALLHAVGAQQLADQGHLLHRPEDLGLDRLGLEGGLVENFHPVRSQSSSSMPIHLQLVYCILNMSQFVFPNALYICSSSCQTSEKLN